MRLIELTVRLSSLEFLNLPMIMADERYFSIAKITPTLRESTAGKNLTAWFIFSNHENTLFNVKLIRFISPFKRYDIILPVLIVMLKQPVKWLPTTQILNIRQTMHKYWLFQCMYPQKCIIFFCGWLGKTGVQKLRARQFGIFRAYTHVQYLHPCSGQMTFH